MLAALLTLSAVAGDYPSAAVLNAFSKVCAARGSFAEMSAGAKNLSWLEFQPTKDSPIDRSIHLIGAPIAGGGPDPEHTATFRKDVAGRYLELLLIQYGTLPGWPEYQGSFGCHVNDFAADHPLGQDAMKTWAGRSPVSELQEPKDASAQDKAFRAKTMPPQANDWTPGVSLGASRTAVIFTPKGSFFNSGGMIGLTILSTWLKLRNPNEHPRR